MIRLHEPSFGEDETDFMAFWHTALCDGCILGMVETDPHRPMRVLGWTEEQWRTVWEWARPAGAGSINALLDMQQEWQVQALPMDFVPGSRQIKSIVAGARQ